MNANAHGKALEGFEKFSDVCMQSQDRSDVSFFLKDTSPLHIEGQLPIILNFNLHQAKFIHIKTKAKTQRAARNLLKMQSPRGTYTVLLKGLWFR